MSTALVGRSQAAKLYEVVGSPGVKVVDSLLLGEKHPSPRSEQSDVLLLHMYGDFREQVHLIQIFRARTQDEFVHTHVFLSLDNVFDCRG
jgi:hypothetical protein